MSDMEQMQRLLQTKNEELEAALASQSRFLATMSHEIRTPLNGILGLVELVLGSALTAQQYDHLKTVQASGEALLTILNDVLDYSKLEAGLMEVVSTPFHPNDLIEHVAKLFFARIDEQKVRFITYDIPMLPYEVLGDMHHLHQVLVNLLSNAVKFTQEGEIVLSVAILAETKRDVLLRFQVRDTGLGIPEDAMQALFDEFTQVDAANRRQYGGTGLGLSIVQRLLGLMGSRIQVSSTYGEGSVFFFDIKLEKTSEKRPKGAHGYQEHFSQWKVLLANEEACYQLMLQHVLQSWGSVCDVCVSAADVLQHLQHEDYDLLLISQSMLDEMLLTHERSFWKTYAKKMVMMIPNHTQVHWDLREHYGLDAFVRTPMFSRSLCETLLSVMGVVAREKRVHEQVEAQGMRSECVLLAEDNKVNQQVALGMLQQQGFGHVDVVENGLEAVEQVKKKVYDLILMDIYMPEMDGLAACREIRALESVQDLVRTPVVALTAHVMSDDAVIQEAGMDACLSKPFTGKALKEMLARFVPLDAVVDDIMDAADAQKSQHSDAPLDADGLTMLRQDIGFGIGAIIDAFVQQLEPEWQAMQAAIAENNGDALRRCAHKMKGGSRSLSALNMGDMCAALEQMGAKGDILSAAPLLETLHEEMVRVQQALEEDWVYDLRV